MEPLNEDEQEMFDEAIERQRRQEWIASMWRDLARLDRMEGYAPEQWDPSMVPNEIRGRWPMETR